jgi:rubredoxin
VVSRNWHIRCRHCGLHYAYEDGITVTHNAGYDWADSSTYCPNDDCGQPQDSSSDYEMIDGPVPV